MSGCTLRRLYAQAADTPNELNGKHRDARDKGDGDRKPEGENKKK